MLTFDERTLIRTLDQLPVAHQVAFALLCVEHLLPSYRLYEATKQDRVVGTADRLVERLWADLEGVSLTAAELVLATQECEELLVSEDDECWDPYAEDAAIALHYAWDGRAGGGSKHAAWAARHVYEALDQFAIKQTQVDVNAPSAEEVLLSHPLVQAELQRQQRDVGELGALAKRGSTEFTAMRDRARAEAKRVFGGV